jgi:integrase
VLAFYAQHKMQQGHKHPELLALSLVKLNEYFAGKKLDDVTLIACDRYVDWRCGQGDARSGSNRRLKPATARNDLTVLDAAQRFAFKNRRLTHIVPISKPAASEARLRFLTRSEVALLLLAALGWNRSGKRNRKRINRRLARFILIAVYTGTRRDRILRLQWIENLEGGWIDLERGILHRRSRAEVETKKRAPSVPIGNRLLGHMRRWRRLSTRYVIERNGRPIEGLFNAWERIARDAGLNYDGQDPADRVVPHTLRHTCVSWLLAEGETMFNIGKFVGMLPTMIERVYGHLNEEQQRATANAFRRSSVTRRAN